MNIENILNDTSKKMKQINLKDWKCYYELTYSFKSNDL